MRGFRYLQVYTPSMHVANFIIDISCDTSYQTLLQGLSVQGDS